MKTRKGKEIGARVIVTGLKDSGYSKIQEVIISIGDELVVATLNKYIDISHK
jgi:hypothetical protein